MPITIRLDKLDLFCDQIRNHQDKVLELECRDTLIISDLKKIYGAISENPRITELILLTAFGNYNYNDDLSQLKCYGFIASLKQLKKIKLLHTVSDTILHIIKENHSITHLSCGTLNFLSDSVFDFFNTITQNTNLQLADFGNVVIFVPFSLGPFFSPKQHHDRITADMESEFSKLLEVTKKNRIKLSIKEIHFHDFPHVYGNRITIQSASKDKWMEALSHDAKKEVAAVETLPRYQFFNKTEPVINSDRAAVGEDRKASVVVSK